MAFLLFDLATSPPKRFASKTVSDITFLRLFLRLKAIILTAFFFCSGLFIRDVYYPYRNVSMCFSVT